MPFAALLAVDLIRFGPFAWPWVYDGVMVRSSRLFFHADPRFNLFWVAAFVNGPLLVLPAIGVWCWVDGDGDRPLARAYGVAVVLALAVLLWRTAAQQVQYQPRHLFAIADAAVMLWLLVLPRVRWRPAAGTAYATVATFFLVWNVCSTFGSQRAHSMARVADAANVVTDHLFGHVDDGRSVFRDLWPAYFDWADSRLLHDTLTVWAAVRCQPRRPLLVIDAAAATADQAMLYAKAFPAFDWCMMRRGRADAATVDRVRAAARPVFLLTAPGRRPPAGVMDVSPPLPLDLLHVALRRVNGVAPAAVDLDAGAVAATTADGLTITRVRGTPRRFDAAHGYLPRVQPEWLSYDADPERVEYDLAGLVAGRRYALGFVTWDADRQGRAVAVSVDGRVLTTVEAVGGVAPDDVVVPLPATAAGHARVSFDNRGRGEVAVCEVWLAAVGGEPRTAK